MLKVNTKEDLTKVFEKCENAKRKYKEQIMRDGYTFESIDNTKTFYVGKPAGIKDFCIVNFTKEENGEKKDIQLCLYELAGKIELYTGSLKKLERSHRELIRRNNIHLHQYVASTFLKVLADKGTVLNGVDIRNMLYSNDVKTRAANIATALNEIYKILPEEFTITETNADGENVKNVYNLKEFFLKELDADTDKDGNLKIKYNDKVYYMKNMLEHTVEEIFDTSFIAENNTIQDYRRNVSYLPHENISSILNVFGHQNEFINFILEKGESKDLENIISNDFVKNGKLVRNKLSLSVCDAIFDTLKRDDVNRLARPEIVKQLKELKENGKSIEEIQQKQDELDFIDDSLIRSGRNKHLYFSMFAPIFSALGGETGIAKGAKNNLKPEIVKYILENRKKDIEFLIELIKTSCFDPKKDKGNLIFQYMEAKRNNDSVRQKEIIEKNFVFDKNTDAKVATIKRVLAELGDDAKDGLYFTGILNKILKGHNWSIKGNILTVEEYNNVLNKKVKHEFNVPEITNIAKEINDKMKKSAIEAATIIQKEGIGQNFTKDGIKVYIEEKEGKRTPVVKFVSYDFSTLENNKKKMKEVVIDFTENEKESILKASKDNNVPKALSQIIEDARCLTRKELDEKMLEVSAIMLNDKFR